MISIIIPCYNCEKFVRRAIESVLSQTLQDWELLLINNNSTDSTQVILEEYQQKLPGKISVYQELKPGAPSARNKGLHNANGNWIQYLDADDELMPNKLKSQADIAHRNELDILAGSFILITERKDRITKKEIIADSKNIWVSLASSAIGRTSANLWRKQALLNVDGWDEELSSSQEYDLLFRLLKKNSRILFDDQKPSTTIYYTENSVSKSADKNRNAQILANWVNLRLQIKEHLEETGRLSKELNKKIDCIIFNYLMDKRHLNHVFVDSQLRKLNLDLPLSLQIRRNYKYVLGKFSKN